MATFHFLWLSNIRKYTWIKYIHTLVVTRERAKEGNLMVEKGIWGFKGQHWIGQKVPLGFPRKFRETWTSFLANLIQFDMGFGFLCELTGSEFLYLTAVLKGMGPWKKGFGSTHTFTLTRTCVSTCRFQEELWARAACWPQAPTPRTHQLTHCFSSSIH